MRVLIILLLLGQNLSAQKLLKGVVVDAEKGAPIPKASIFLNNTSIGTAADNEGQFSLNIPAGRFDLIVSSVGYATQNININAAEVADFITVKLMLKTPELETVVIEPFMKDGWKEWGRWFTENFIGTSEYGRNCRILNHEVLRFRNSKQQNALTVIATAPLLIENKGLGYLLTYQLENFRYDFGTRYLFYAGYPYFKNLDGPDRKRRRWEASREDVYKGSMLQFMRALYRNRIAEEGFEIRSLKKINNDEKTRIKLLYRTSVRPDAAGRMVSTINRDSSGYYEHILQEPDYRSVIGKTLLVGDSIAYAMDSTTAGFAFNDYLLVTYKHKSVPAEFRQAFPKSDAAMRSEITLINGKPVEVYANGMHYSPEDLMSSGYWGWWEKIGTMLPFDYKPSK